MAYDYYIASMSDDFYMADAICRELEKHGKKCFFNWRDSKNPEKLDFFTLGKCDNCIIIANKTSVSWDYYKYTMNRRAKLAEGDDGMWKNFVFLNEDIEAFPKAWGTMHVFNAQMGITSDMIFSMLGSASFPIWTIRNAKEEEAARKAEAKVQQKSKTTFSAQPTNFTTNTPVASVAAPEKKIVFERVDSCGAYDFISVEESMSNTVKRAVRYFLGKGVPQDYERAFSLFNKAVEENTQDFHAYYGLAGCYQSGLGCPQDISKAKELYSKAKELGLVAASIRLASLLIFNEADIEGARTLLEDIAASGDHEAIYMLGVADETDDKYNESVEHFSESAELGNAKAQNALGCLYAEGKGVKKDFSKAMQWFEFAANQGLIVSHYNLALILVQEEGEKFEQGVNHLRIAADAGHVEAKSAVAEIDKRVEEAKQAELRRKRAAERKRREEQDASDGLDSFFKSLDLGGIASYAKDKLWD